jgi:hypothetical protein
MIGREAIQAAVMAAQPFEPPPETAEETVARLAALPALQYDQNREAEAERLNVRLSTLDLAVEEMRAKAMGGCIDAGDFLTDPEPWPEPVNAGDLLARINGVAKTHLVMPNGAAEAVALWVLHAHAHDCFAISPVLCITSPTPE